MPADAPPTLEREHGSEMPEAASSVRAEPEPSASGASSPRDERLTLEELDPEEEARRKKDASAAALTLEMVGDLPHADIRPPENVLFVCKLNPVTRSEDLELIFSRFGQIHSCEVVKDKKVRRASDTRRVIVCNMHLLSLMSARLRSGYVRLSDARPM